MILSLSGKHGAGRIIAVHINIPVMKPLCLFLLVALSLIGTKARSQKISLDLVNQPLELALKKIQEQSNIRFVYARVDMKTARNITIRVTNVSLETALTACFKDQPLQWMQESNIIMIRALVEKAPGRDSLIPIRISGQVIDERSQPIPSVTISSSKQGVLGMSDTNGRFTLDRVQEGEMLGFSSVGYQDRMVFIRTGKPLIVQMDMLRNNLEESVVIGYGRTTRRLNTGSVGKISSAEIEKQPVSNPLATLQGRIPGLFVTQSNGLPGSSFSVLIRGRNSLQNGNSPLYIIDGVPFLNDADKLTQRSSLNANHPFNTLNPADIESIEILKDADATSIYGSRGANGVILITTKKAQKGMGEILFSCQSGWGRVSRLLPMMNTTQYLAMRREAFRNDNIIPNSANAPDLLLWDSTRNINWSRELLGGTSRTQNASLSYSGGSEFTQFKWRANHYDESAVFPGNLGEKRTSLTFSIHHNPASKVLDLQSQVSYAHNRSELLSQDLTGYISTPPNAPSPYDSSGRLNWQEKGARFGNPYAILLQSYTGKTDRLSWSTALAVRLGSGITARINGGFNQLYFTETGITPLQSLDPVTNPKGSANFGRTNVRSWIVEPQLDHIFSRNAWKIQSLVGATLQYSETSSSLTRGTGYTNDVMIGSIAGAGSISATDNYSQYKYLAAFARININYRQKYLLNLTGRRDGSSRFGPDSQFANFGSIGTAWIFSNEPFVRSAMPFVSFGKLRFSTGTTGNDQIGDYNYLDTWAGTAYPFQNQPGLSAARLNNPSYSWEQIRKIELASEWGFLKDRVLFTVSWFHSTSSNQLLYVNLPSQTGFTGILDNFPGKVQNAGWEFQLSATPIQQKNFHWSSSLNLTVARNKLKEFPGLENSVYSTTYAIGYPINSRIGFHYTGMDTQKGVYLFEDVNKDAVLNAADYKVTGSTQPDYYGGLENTFEYRGIAISFLFQFVKQMGVHPVYSNFSFTGQRRNEPVLIGNRWRQSGDQASFQRYSQQFGSLASTASFRTANSELGLTDASFIRLKNLSVNYTIPTRLLNQHMFRQIKIFFLAQNLFVLTRFPGSDPETQLRQVLPPMRMLSAGAQFNL